MYIIDKTVLCPKCFPAVISSQDTQLETVYACPFYPTYGLFKQLAGKTGAAHLFENIRLFYGGYRWPGHARHYSRQQRYVPKQARRMRRRRGIMRSLVQA
jgi:hypothetical protein